MKLKSLSQLIALLSATALMAGLSSGCGNKTNAPEEQAATATNAPAQQPTPAANSAAEQAATAAAQKWLTEIDSGRYAQSWQDASALFQGAISQQKWESALTGVRKPLGDLVSRNLESAKYTTELPGAPNGQYVVMQFDTSFANKKSATETVTFMLEKDGQWKSAGYFIK